VWYERLKTGVMVVLLTGLVWFFADQANMDTITVPVALEIQVPSGSNLVVLRHEPAPLEFEVTFRAPRGVIRQLAGEMQSRRWRPVFRVSRGASPGRLELDSAKMLAEVDAIKQRGLGVSAARPERFSVEIDRITTVTMRIEPQFGDLQAEAVEVQPEQVQVSLPSVLAQGLDGDVLKVDVTEHVRGSARPDQAQAVTVPLRWPQQVPEAKFVQFDPAEVTVRFRLKGWIATRELPGVQVAFYIPPDVLKRYDPVPVDPAEFRPNIQLRGPKQIVESLTRQDIRLLVEVLTSDEANVGKPIRRKVVAADLPAGVELLEPVPEVRFILKPRASGD